MLRFMLRFMFRFMFNNDGLGSLCYTTNLLKNGCLACISPSYDQDAKMRTIISILEHCNGLFIYIHGKLSYLEWLGAVL